MTGSDRDGTLRLLLEPPGPRRVAARYLPVAALVIAFAAIVATMPSKISSSQGNVPTGQWSAPPAAKGVTVAGVKCKPGVRQLPFSHYGPMCTPAWQGNNGGATAPGVTAKTITITYRSAISPSEQELYSLVAPSVVGTNAGTIQAMRAYIKVFNKYFDLYGRHVVLKPFNGKGDFLNEDENNGAPQAQADAATAKSLGAFADISLLSSTALYDKYLADNKIISINPVGLVNNSWFEKYAPYAYSTSADCETLAAGGASFLGRAMAGMPAIYAGSATLRSSLRKIAILYPATPPTYAACVQGIASDLENLYHVKPAAIIGYAIDLGTLTQQAQTTMEHLKADGVTTILCGCDPVSPVLMTDAAANIGYYPEWFWFDIGDAFARLMNQSEWAHALGAGQQDIPIRQQGGFKVFQMAYPHQLPTPTFGFVYASMLLFYSALQEAGPDLTPYTFEQGFFHLPPSAPGGEFGYWRFGNDVFAPASSDQVLWWDPNAISVVDGKKGAWRVCNGGAQYAATPGIGPNVQVPPFHKQLQCFSNAPPPG